MDSHFQYYNQEMARLSRELLKGLEELKCDLFESMIEIDNPERDFPNDPKMNLPPPINTPTATPPQRPVKRQKRKKISSSDDDDKTETEMNEDFKLDDLINGINLAELQRRARMQESYTKMMTHVWRDMPKEDEIFFTPMDEEHRAELWAHYRADVDKMYGEPDTLEAFRSRRFLRKKIQEYTRSYEAVAQLPEADRERFLNERKEMTDYIQHQSASMENRILRLDAPKEVKAAIYKEYNNLKDMKPTDHEYDKLRRWIDTALALPYSKVHVMSEMKSPERLLSQVREILDRKLYGMETVKEKFLLFLNERLFNPASKSLNLALIGPPGVGKTSIVRAFTEVTQLPFFQIACGNMSSAAVMSGHSYTYTGARPGEIVKALTAMKARNGIIFFDEFNKLFSSQKLVSIMMQILDPAQNHNYTDNYLGSEIALDLSRILFVCSMNEKPNSEALNDRLYFIQVPGYTAQTKTKILTTHMFQKLADEHSLSGNVILTEEMASYIVRRVSPEDGGVRAIEHAVEDLMSKIFYIKCHGQSPNGKKYKIKFPYQLTEDIISELLDKGSKNELSDNAKSLYM